MTFTLPVDTSSSNALMTSEVLLEIPKLIWIGIGRIYNAVATLGVDRFQRLHLFEPVLLSALIILCGGAPMVHASCASDEYRLGYETVVKSMNAYGGLQSFDQAGGVTIESGLDVQRIYNVHGQALVQDWQLKRSRDLLQSDSATIAGEIVP